MKTIKVWYRNNKGEIKITRIKVTYNEIIYGTVKERINGKILEIQFED